ncbi:hypothetical protein GKE62_02015 [Novosphingobium sp. Gsoil 351]|nr:hypothetical protein GKE62_02015 [Novosphingobium sp. Gsoil 351]
MASHAAAKLSAPSRRRRRYAVSRAIETRRAASQTEPVIASAARKAACRRAVQPSLRERVATGTNAGTRG